MNNGKLICSIAQSLHYIVPFKVGIIREQFFDAHSLANLSNDHADCYPHAANTGLAPHNRRILSYPIKVVFVHKASIMRNQEKNKQTVSNVVVPCSLANLPKDEQNVIDSLVLSD